MTTKAVTFPNISEYLARSIQSLLVFYANPNIVITYNGLRIKLTEVEVAFSINRLTQPAVLPNIVFAGSRTGNQVIEKIQNTLPPGYQYELRIHTPRSVFVRYALVAGNENNVMKQALQLWDTLFAICATRHDIWARYNIFYPKLDVSPVQVSGADEQNIVLRGDFDCELHVPFSRCTDVTVSGTDFGITDIDDIVNLGVLSGGF